MWLTVDDLNIMVYHSIRLRLPRVYFSPSTIDDPSPGTLLAYSTYLQTFVEVCSISMSDLTEHHLHKYLLREREDTLAPSQVVRTLVCTHRRVYGDRLLIAFVSSFSQSVGAVMPSTSV
jgi:hypothetical protein